MSDLRSYRQSATHFWERGRILYNLALIPAAAFGYAGRAGLSARLEDMPEVTAASAVCLFSFCMVCANLLYSFAYALEFLLVDSPLAARWSGGARSVALAVGTIIGMGVAFNSGHFIALVQYPSR